MARSTCLAPSKCRDSHAITLPLPIMYRARGLRAPRILTTSCPILSGGSQRFAAATVLSRMRIMDCRYGEFE